MTRLLMAVLVALGLGIAVSSSADAQDTLTCEDFSSLAEAQAALDADPTDPNELDEDDDGIACENFSFINTDDDTDDPDEPVDDTDGDTGSGTDDTDDDTDDDPDGGTEEDTGTTDTTTGTTTTSAGTGPTLPDTGAGVMAGGPLPLVMVLAYLAVICGAIGVAVQIRRT